MQMFAFTPLFVQAMGRFRLAFSAWVALLGLLHHRSVDALTPELMIRGVGCLLALSVSVCFLWILLCRPRPQGMLMAAHILESAVITLCAVLLQFNPLSLMWLLVIALGANLALWGWWHMISVLCCMAITYMVVRWLLSPAELCCLPPDDELMWLVATSAVGFILAICGLAHGHGQRLVAISRSLREDKNFLLRYLPNDMPHRLSTPAVLDVKRAWMTVVFVDMREFTRATYELPVEALTRLVHNFIAQVDEHVEAWGGNVSKFLGDGVLCIFPAEQVSDRQNAAQQALRCISQLPQRLTGIAPALESPYAFSKVTVSCGVASGYCSAGDWGSHRRLDYTVIGSPVNLAQRLQALANSYSGVLIDETTKHLLARPTSIRDAAVMLSLKGIGETAAYPWSRRDL